MNHVAMKLVSAFRQAALVGGLLCLGVEIVAGQNPTLTVSASPAAMKITTATAGLPPNSITNALGTYKANTDDPANPMKVTGHINAIMPPGMTLKITLVAQTGATSSGAVTLDATDRMLVGNITNIVAQSKSITYVLSATAAAGVVTSQSRIVTFTFLAWP